MADSLLGDPPGVTSFGNLEGVVAVELEYENANDVRLTCLSTEFCRDGFADGCPTEDPLLYRPSTLCIDFCDLVDL